MVEVQGRAAAVPMMWRVLIICCIHDLCALPAPSSEKRVRRVTFGEGPNETWGTCRSEGSLEQISPGKIEVALSCGYRWQRNDIEN
jgi:hypothetical protein